MVFVVSDPEGQSRLMTGLDIVPSSIRVFEQKVQAVGSRYDGRAQ